MPTQQQAQNYLNTLTPAQQAEVQASLQASGSTLLQWFQAAIGAGVPGAIMAGGGRQGAAEGGWEEEGGATADWLGAAEPSTWLGKRMPTAQEARKWANQQHAAYIAGDRSSQDEDYERYTDRQVMAWFNEGWDAKAGGWKSGFGAKGVLQAAGGVPGGPGGGAKVGQRMAGGLLRSTAASAFTPEQTRLADLQRVLEDQLLGRGGIFGLADARTGSSGVRTSDLFGQSLSEGGLWWGADKGMFDPNKPLNQRQGRRPAAAAPALPAAAAAPALPVVPPAPAGIGGGAPPRRINDAMYRKFPTRGPFDRFMT